MDWFTAFILTLLVELPVLLFLLGDYGFLRVLVCGFLLNVVSHPLLWFVFPLFLSGSYSVFCGELLVVFVEYVLLVLFFRCEPRVRLLLSSLAVNLLSFFVGEVLYLFT